MDRFKLAMKKLPIRYQLFKKGQTNFDAYQIYEAGDDMPGMAKTIYVDSCIQSRQGKLEGARTLALKSMELLSNLVYDQNVIRRPSCLIVHQPVLHLQT